MSSMQFCRTKTPEPLSASAVNWVLAVNDPSKSVSLSADLRYWALQSKLEEVQVQRLDDGLLVGTLPLAGYPHTLQFLPGPGVILGAAVGYPRSLDEWDVAGWKSLKTHGLPDELLNRVAFWGRYLVIDKTTATVFRDTVTSQPWLELTRKHPLERVSNPSEFLFSPDGNSLAIMGETSWFFEAPDGRAPRQLNLGHVRAISNGGKFVAGSAGTYALAVIEPASNRPPINLRHPAPIGDIAFSPDGKTLAVCCGERTVCLWNVASGQELARLVARADALIKVQFSPDSRRLAAVSRIGIRPKNIYHTYPDGIRATACEESTAVITIWSGIEGL